MWCVNMNSIWDNLLKRLSAKFNVIIVFTTNSFRRVVFFVDMLFCQTTGYIIIYKIDVPESCHTFERTQTHTLRNTTRWDETRIRLKSEISLQLNPISSSIPWNLQSTVRMRYVCIYVLIYHRAFKLCKFIWHAFHASSHYVERLVGVCACIYYRIVC